MINLHQRHIFSTQSKQENSSYEHPLATLQLSSDKTYRTFLQTNLSHAITFIPFYPGIILIKHWFPININSISTISRSFLSMSISISITKTGPYQYQYLINFSKFSLPISIPISISWIFLINISLSMHWAALLVN